MNTSLPVYSSRSKHSFSYHYLFLQSIFQSIEEKQGLVIEFKNEACFRLLILKVQQYHPFFTKKGDTLIMLITTCTMSMHYYDITILIKF